MPYKSIDEVSVNLPPHAKEIFMKAFNSSWEKYHNEKRAFRIAWGAVKNAGYGKSKRGGWAKK